MNILTIAKAVNMKKGAPALITGISSAIALGIAIYRAVKENKQSYDDNIIEGTCYDNMDNKEEFDNNVNEIHQNETEVEDAEINEMAEDAAE